jgi:hypothetical protein
MNRKYDLTDPPGVVSPAKLRAEAMEEASTPTTQPPVPTTTAPGASNSQLNYLIALLQSREMPEEARDTLSRRVAIQIQLNEEHGDRTPPLAANGLTLRRATQFIARLKTKPQRQRDRSQSPRDIARETAFIPGPDRVSTGHYAIKNKDGELRFYRVWRGTRNPNWVKLYLEHGNSDTEIPFKSGEFKGIMLAIGADPLFAARLYGRHIGCCSECHHRLTNRVSRLLDIGPICGGHKCDPAIWKDMVARAKAALRDAGLDPDADVEDTDDLDRIRELARL